jgi:hypothetical protein
VPIPLEHLDVARQKVNPVGVQQLQVTVKNLHGQFVIQTGLFVVVVGQESRCDAAGIALVHIRLEPQGIHRIYGGQRGTRAQQKNNQRRKASHLFQTPEINAKYSLTHPLSHSETLFMHVSDKIYNAEVQFDVAAAARLVRPAGQL